jgi:hypothetical protein
MEQTSFAFSHEIPPDSCIALGDCHGQFSLLEQFVEWVKGSDARIILLGDLIDRSRNPGDDLRVLNLVRSMCEGPAEFGLSSCTSLVGNHEMLLLGTFEGYGWGDWVMNGGAWEEWKELFEYADWLKQLPYYVTVGNTLFTHSGGVYGKPPSEFMGSLSNREQFVWSRTACRKGAGLREWSNTLEKCVFGHSPDGAMPYLVGDSICIDTAAFCTGTLTAYNATYNTFNQFVLA